MKKLIIFIAFITIANTARSSNDVPINKNLKPIYLQGDPFVNFSFDTRFDIISNLSHNKSKIQNSSGSKDEIYFYDLKERSIPIFHITLDSECTPNRMQKKKF